MQIFPVVTSSLIDFTIAFWHLWNYWKPIDPRSFSRIQAWNSPLVFFCAAADLALRFVGWKFWLVKRTCNNCKKLWERSEQLLLTSDALKCSLISWKSWPDNLPQIFKAKNGFSHTAKLVGLCIPQAKHSLLVFFGSKLLGYPRAVRPSVSSNYRNGQIQLWTKTFIPKNEFIKQINKHINSPRSSESKTRKPFLESSHRRCTGRSAESSHWVGDTCDKSAFDRRKGSTDDERYLENKTCWLASPVKLKPQGDRRRAWKLWENRWNAKNWMSSTNQKSNKKTKKQQTYTTPK